MKTKAIALLLTAALGTAIAGCSSSPSSKPSAGEAKKTETPAPKPPEIDTGRVAFQRLYLSARNWAADARPFRLESEPTKQATGIDGKAGVWRGSFASAARRAVKSFLWSGITADDAPARGITPGSEDTFNPSNTSTQPFDFGFLKVDSDKAFEVAQEHGGKKLTAKTPDQPIKYELDWAARNNELVWHVIYGSSDADAKLRVAVDATTGSFLRLER